jgi:ferredoxin-type protein NapH
MSSSSNGVRLRSSLHPWAAPRPADDAWPGAASRRARALRWVARLRPVLQLGTLVLVLAPLWWPAISASLPIYQGTFAASRLNVPPLSVPLADPFSALSVMVASQAVPPRLALGAGLVLSLYVLVRARAFCAYACPIHLVLEGWDRVLLKRGIQRESIGARGWPGSAPLVTVLLLAASWAVGLPAYEPVNPVNTLVRCLQRLSLAGLGIVGGLLALEALAGRRVFCRHVCPMGGFYSALNRVGTVGLAVDPGACTGCRNCTVHCLAAPELDRAIDKARRVGSAPPVGVESAHCTLCLDCVSRCAHDAICFRNRWGRTPAPPPVDREVL